MLDFMMVMVHDRTSIPTAKKLMWLLKGGNLSYTDFPAATLWMANKMNHSEFSMFKMFCRLFCHHHREVLYSVASRG